MTPSLAWPARTVVKKARDQNEDRLGAELAIAEAHF